MKEATIIRYVKGNIESRGSLFGGLSDCILCAEAKLRKPAFCNICEVCSLWDFISKPKCDITPACGWISYKGEPLLVWENKLAGNKPALRALLNGLVNHFGKED